MKDSLFYKSYLIFAHWASCLQSPFLFLIRLFWGSSFLMGGWGKLHSLSSVAEFFSSLGIPFPLLNAYAVSLVEFLGGAMLILGLGTRFFALALSIVMIVALFTAHHEAVFNAWNDPDKLLSQTPFTYLFACLVIFIFGPGKIALDYVIRRMQK